MNPVFSSFSLSIRDAGLMHLSKVGEKPRPLKITLPNTTLIHQVLKVKSSLRNIPSLKHLTTHTDKTSMQQQ